ncbi:MAG: Omp28-related outer membrane protein [Calditrichia bacterium]
MKKVLLFIVFSILLSSSAWTQVRRVVLIEEATNASCVPCAQNNPNLQAFFSTHFGGVISVRYHAWWPGSDPMYDLNIDENTNRIQYYGINGVPNYLMNGTNYGVPGDPGGMIVQMDQHMQNESPVKIQVSADFAADSVEADVKIIALAPVTQTNLRLRTALIERMITYASPPGSNGEKVFPDVMRKMLPDANGISTGTINAGDTLEYSFKVAVNSAWNWQDLAVVSWLQSETSKEVIQSGINVPVYVLESSDPSADLLQPNQQVSKDYSMVNDNLDTLNVRISPRITQLPAGWTYDLIFNSQVVDSFQVSLPPGDSLHFMVNVQAGTEGAVRAVVQAINMDDPYLYRFNRGYFGTIAEGNVLFVDDDGGDPYETGYYQAFDSAGVTYTAVAESDLLMLSNVIDPTQFQAIFWNISWGFPAFVPDDITFLQNYLDNGGQLFVAGQDIGWDVFDPSGSTNFTLAHDFYHNYLDADYINDNSGIYSMEGIPGDPITDGLSFNISTVYSRYPESIASFSGSSVPILKYTGSSQYGGLRYDSGTFKTVYLGVGLEQMSDAAAAQAIIERTLQWFGVTSGIQDEPLSLITKMELQQNYPNPFNPVTTIRFALPAAEKVNLRIFNSLGQEVRHLINDIHPAGWHTVQWDGKNDQGMQVSSGLYFYSLTIGKETLSRKMMLLR